MCPFGTDFKIIHGADTTILHSAFCILHFYRLGVSSS